MTGRPGPLPRAIAGFNWRLLLLARIVIVVAAVAATWLLLRFWQAPFSPNQIYAVVDIVLSCAAVSRLRKAGWGLVAVHMLVSVIWCETALLLPAGWFH